jgi:predicted dehydrogenase
VTTLRIAVVGAGHMGRIHAQKVVALGRAGGGVTLAGVADVDLERAARVAAETGTRACGGGKEIFAKADAAIVAVPSVEHGAVVRAALEAGLDVLVEKPIAAALAEGEQLVDLARSRGAILQVGHQEGFNAALEAVRARIRAPRFVEARRMGPFPDRGTDVDVVRDLMIHDLEILQRLLGGEPDRIEAIGVPVVTDRADVANARIAFPGGCVADLTASRVSAARERTLNFFQRDGCLSVDFLNQSAVVVRRLEPEGGGSTGMEREDLSVDRGDALLTQLRAFVEASRTREPPPVSGREAVGALRTALRVVEAMTSLEDLQ